jgi:membrane-associated phospholipid phosphatase
MKGTLMKHIVARAVIVAAVCVLGANRGGAQDGPPAADAAPPAGAAATPAEHGWASQIVRDVGGDYLHFLSKENALSLGLGGAAALAVHPADESLSEWALEQDSTWVGADTYGSQLVQLPLALAVWAVGAAAGSGTVAETGRDLLRAQISVVSWTYLIKVAAQRTRPNGDPRSFPSGHASNSFATAMVLQEHFGWKAGVPAFALAAYTAGSRIVANQHWASDVVFGAFVGMASGRTATIHLRDKRFALAPLAAPGGGGVLVTVLR